MRMGWVGASAADRIPFSLAGIAGDNQAKYSFANLANPSSFVMSTDGTTQLVLGDNTEVRAYSTGTDYYMSGSSNTNTGALSHTSTHIFVSPDGTKLYATSWSTTTIYEYTMATPWTPSTLSYSGRSFNTLSGGGDGGQNIDDTTGSIHISDDGTKLTTYDTANKNFVVYDIGGTPWELASVTHSSSTPTFPTYLNSPNSVDAEDWCFDPTGKSIIFTGTLNADSGFKRIDVTNAFDVEGGMAGSTEGSFNVQSEIQNPISVTVSAEGDKIYFIDDNLNVGGWNAVTENTYFSTGYISFLSGGFSNVDLSAGVAWASPWNAHTVNGNDTTASMTPGQHSDYLQALGITNTLNNLPDTATVTGMRIYLYGYHSGDQSNIKVLPVGLTSSTNSTVQLDSEGWRDQGGDGFMWGNATITKAQLDAAGFGFRVYQDVNADTFGNYYGIDAMNIEVFYTMPE